MERLRKFHFVPKVYDTILNKRQKREFLKHLDREQLLFLLECVINIQNKNLPLDDVAIKKLERHKNSIKYLSCPKNNLNQKRIKIQKGGFASFLIPLLATALPLVVEAFKKKDNNNNFENE